MNVLVKSILVVALTLICSITPCRAEQAQQPMKGRPAVNNKAPLDWRDADRSWYAKVDDSKRGGHFNDNAQIVVADDGAWICSWSTGKHEGSGDMEVVYSVSKDKGITWSKKKPIEPLIPDSLLDAMKVPKR
jgi:hypothetical protein